MKIPFVSRKKYNAASGVLDSHSIKSDMMRMFLQDPSGNIYPDRLINDCLEKTDVIHVFAATRLAAAIDNKQWIPPFDMTRAAPRLVRDIVVRRRMALKRRKTR